MRVGIDDARPLPPLHRPRLRRRARRRLAAVAAAAAGGGRHAAASPTSSTSPTTSCSASASRCTPTTATRIPGGVLTARRARPGERVVTLDGKERALDPDVLVIADGAGVVRHRGRHGRRRLGDRGRDARPWCSRRPTSSASGIAARLHAASACAPTPRTASAAASTPSSPRAGSRWAAELLVDLADARPVRRAQDVVRATCRSASASCCATPASSGCSALPSPHAETHDILGAPRLRAAGASPAGTRRRCRPGGARRDPRDRPRRGGRAHPRARAAPGHPAAARQAVTAASRASRRSAGGSRTRWPAPACRRRITLVARAGATTCRSATASRRTTRGAGLCALEDPLTADHAVVRRRSCRACCAPCGATATWAARTSRCSPLGPVCCWHP